MSAAEMLLLLAAIYLLCGLVFAAVFASWGVQRLDHAARGTSLGFHLIIVPGSVALWPLLAVRLMQAARHGESS